MTNVIINDSAKGMCPPVSRVTCVDDLVLHLPMKIRARDITFDIFSLSHLPEDGLRAMVNFGLATLVLEARHKAFKKIAFGRYNYNDAPKTLHTAMRKLDWDAAIALPHNVDGRAGGKEYTQDAKIRVEGLRLKACALQAALRKAHPIMSDFLVSLMRDKDIRACRETYNTMLAYLGVYSPSVLRPSFNAEMTGRHFCQTCWWTKFKYWITHLFVPVKIEEGK